MTRLQRIVKHVKEIFTTGEGYYINEQGETVHGKLPRVKVENPFRTIMRPSAMSKFPRIRNSSTDANHLYRLCLLFCWMDGMDHGRI